MQARFFTRTARPRPAAWRRGGGALLVAALVAALGCSREPPQKGAPSTAPSAVATASAASAPSAGVGAAAQPVVMLRVGVSAYAATLALDEDVVYLLTAHTVYRLRPGAPSERMDLELGLSPALTSSHILYWSQGALWRTPKQGGEPSTVARVPHQPQRLVAAGERLAWLDRADDGRFTLQSLNGDEPRVLHAPAGSVTALTLLEDEVYFIEQAPDETWRVGAVALSGGAARYTKPRRGRPPATLAAARELFFYDAGTYSVRRLASDLLVEETVASDLVCSPIAAAEHVYCAEVAGLFEVRGAGARPAALPRSTRGLITSVAASLTRVAWLVDTGADELAVEMLPLEQAPR